MDFFYLNKYNYYLMNINLYINNKRLIMEVQGINYTFEQTFDSRIKVYEKESVKQIGLTPFERVSPLSAKLVDKSSNISNTALRIAALAMSYFTAVIEAVILVPSLIKNSIDLVKHSTSRSFAAKVLKTLHQRNLGKNVDSEDLVAKEMGGLFAKFLVTLDPSKRKQVLSETLKYLNEGPTSYKGLDKNKRAQLTQIFTNETASKYIELEAKTIVESVATPKDFATFGKRVDVLSEQVAVLFEQNLINTQGLVEKSVSQSIKTIEEKHGTDFVTFVELKDSFIQELVGNKDAISYQEEVLLASFNSEYTNVRKLLEKRNSELEKSVKSDPVLTKAIKEQAQEKKILTRIKSKIEKTMTTFEKEMKSQAFKTADAEYQNNALFECNKKLAELVGEKQVIEEDINRLQMIIEGRRFVIQDQIKTKYSGQIAHEEGLLVRQFLPKLIPLYEKMINYDVAATYGKTMIETVIAQLSGQKERIDIETPLSEIARQAYHHFETTDEAGNVVTAFDDFQISITEDMAAYLFTRALVNSAKEKDQRYDAANFLMQRYTNLPLSNQNSEEELNALIEFEKDECAGNDSEFHGLEQLIHDQETDEEEFFVNKLVGETKEAMLAIEA